MKSSLMVAGQPEPDPQKKKKSSLLLCDLAIGYIINTIKKPFCVKYIVITKRGKKPVLVGRCPTIDRAPFALHLI
jgi:hypothetical protein